MTTLGTGIGSALLYNGVLIPNSEIGHLEIDGHDAEDRAASVIRDDENLSWAQWAERLQRYYSHVEDLLWPDLIVVGGGVSKKADKFLPLLHLRAPIVAAALANSAGIIGAAWWRGRVTSTRWPNSGRRSNQPRSSRATSPQASCATSPRRRIRGGRRRAGRGCRPPLTPYRWSRRSLCDRLETR